ncbi:LRR receptor-like serine/threonine-protein kinase EFR [Corylus avellana]|uniref:LRR receptor-like serine/threonine-protein kinase EFR n=1 Tax=Corylus avellana TaxID=13451 RepID=UPI00286B7FA0|nr:LRR receptor-like serine/threonine-protein kinase EFR [Corylus avellana]
MGGKSHLTQELSLALNNFVGKIPEEIGRLQRLSFFEVVGNNLTGKIPYAFYNISTMSIISTAVNYLSGTLPANIGHTLPNLKILSISTNQFSGPIPLSLSNASKLQVLAFSKNNFVGQVPTDLGNLPNLWWLGVEYGMGSDASKEEDVYSFEIFALELFTGKRPIDKMFEDDFDLYNFVKMALSERLMQIVDPNFLTREVNEMSMPIENASYKYDHRDDIEEEEESHIENLSRMNANMQKCLLSVFKISLACSLESPKERTNMQDVTRELHRIKNAFLGIGYGPTQEHGAL